MRTILFAEDNKNYREICKRILEEEGYRVLLARNGAEALSAVQAEHPNLAILDIHMPMKGGLETAELINKMDPNIPIILYTANDDTCARDRRSRFATACVEKSSDFTELTIAIDRVLTWHNRGGAFRFGLNPTPGETP